MNILSLFDGKSSGYTAAELAGIDIDNYYSAEIDKYAIQVSNAIHPNQVRLGSVTEWRDWNINWSSIDIVLGGFPCQAWSMAGKQLGDKDERGMLFWTMLDIIKHVRRYNPNADFLIENVKMKKEFEQYITQHTERALGEVYKTLINSALVSAQNRNRYYWTSFPVNQPKDRDVALGDILEPHLPSCGVGGRIVGRRLNDLGKREDYSMEIPISQYLEIRTDEKSNCLTTVYKDSVVPYFKTDRRLKIKFEQGKASCLTGGAHSGGNHSDMDILVIDPDIVRRYSVRECFRLQTSPEHYINKILNCGVSNTQLYKIAGNGWTDEVIAHIFRCMKQEINL